jgi:hypothetical protein
VLAGDICVPYADVGGERLHSMKKHSAIQFDLLCTPIDGKCTS